MILKPVNFDLYISGRFREREGEVKDVLYRRRWEAVQCYKLLLQGTFRQVCILYVVIDH